MKFVHSSLIDRIDTGSQCVNMVLESNCIVYDAFVDATMVKSLEDYDEITDNVDYYLSNKGAGVYFIIIEGNVEFTPDFLDYGSENWTMIDCDLALMQKLPEDY